MEIKSILLAIISLVGLTNAWSGSIFSVPQNGQYDNGNGGNGGNYNYNYNTNNNRNIRYYTSNGNSNPTLTRSYRSLFPNFFPQDPFASSSSPFDSSPSVAPSTTTTTSSDSGNGKNVQDSYSSPLSSSSSSSYVSPALWGSRNYWWSSVPTVKSAVRNLDSAATFSSPTDSSFSQPTTSTTAAEAPAVTDQQPTAIPTQEPITATTQQQQDTSAYTTPTTAAATDNVAVYTSAPSTQQPSTSSPDDIFTSRPVPTILSSRSPYKTNFKIRKLRKSFAAPQQQQQQPFDFSSLFDQNFKSDGKYVSADSSSHSVVWPPAGSTVASPSSSFEQQSPSPPSTQQNNNNVPPTPSGPITTKYYSLPAPEPTSPTNQQTTAGSINSNQTAFQQGGNLVTYTTVKKKFLKTTIGKINHAADFQNIFENIGDPSLKPGEYLDGPFKRQVGSTNPALSLTQQDTLSSPELQQALVDKHNVLRASVQPQPANMMKMVWNQKAAEKAAEWTKECKFAHDPHEQRRSDHFKCGQNLARGVPDPVSWDTVVQLWFEEHKYFNFGQEPGGVVGHYTQLVWAQSFELGCAHTKCGSWHYYVCNYCPVGNIKKRKFEPYVIGDKCSKCPNNCDSNGLCNNYCMVANDYGNCDELQQSNGICQRPELASKCSATCTCKNANMLY